MVSTTELKVNDRPGRVASSCNDNISASGWIPIDYLCKMQSQPKMLVSCNVWNMVG